MPQNIDKLDDSFESAYQSLQRKKSNLAFAFFCLDRQRAQDMGVLYAYCRILDDISDDENAPVEEKKAALLKWKSELDLIYSNKPCSRFGEELKEMIARRRIPKQYMNDVIDGVYRDTELKPFKTSQELANYCYGVASAVGLCSIYVFGFENQITIEFAKSLGLALQYTNILRDIVDDFYTQKRVYIPENELEFFGVKASDLGDPKSNPKCKDLFRFLAFRAKHYFNKSRRLLCEQDRKNMLPALIMSEIYEAILDRIIASNYDIKRKIVKLNKAQKIYYALKAMAKAKLPFAKKRFGTLDIFGAGISGMTAAYNLCEQGFDIRLFEARNYAGGRACSFEWKAANALLDNGSHAAMRCYKSFLKILKKLGSLDILSDKETAVSFFFEDKSTIKLSLKDLVKNPIKFMFTFGGLNKVDGFQCKENALFMIKAKLGLAKPMPAQSADDFLNSHNINDVSKDVFWKPFCESALNTKLEECDAEIFLTTLKKSLLSIGANLLFFKKPISSGFFPKIEFYIKACGGEFNLGESVLALNFDGDKLLSFSTEKRENIEIKYAVSALNCEALRGLLPSKSQLAQQLSKISQSDILNLHFTTNKKLFEGQSACLVRSPIHWIFDKNDALKQPLENEFLYSATISTSGKNLDAKSAKLMLENEIKTYFADANVLKLSVVMCKSATIKADTKSETARPAGCGFYQNFFVVGDYAKCDLPCTMESAAFNALSLKL